MRNKNNIYIWNPCDLRNSNLPLKKINFQRFLRVYIARAKKILQSVIFSVKNEVILALEIYVDCGSKYVFFARLGLTSCQALPCVFGCLGRALALSILVIFVRTVPYIILWSHMSFIRITYLSLIHIWRCRRLLTCRSRWSPYH